MSESATAYAEEIQTLGEKIVGLTLKQAKELSDYLKDVHGIEAAAGGAVVMAAPADGAGAAAAVVEKTEFDVVLTSFGDKKLDVVKIVKNLTGLSLIDSKKLVEAAPSKIKEQVSKEDAEKIKKELTEVGATVELK
ncbi:MAG: 50S ribosomal protein L7/L12 [Planctomycetota bacterium]|jgi:large subunit ribosomal protein L7/L12|nr:50S ribosomal protein L7/L12 [Planctomycetota bacterium]